MILKVCCSLFILVIVIASQQSFSENRYIYKATVASVIDGDTIEIQRDKTREKRKIRFWGIDAPEWDQPFSFEAKQFLKQHIVNKRISIHHLYYDDYNRSVALVKYNGKSINHLLVIAGYAWVHPVYCKHNICEEWKNSQNIAKTDKRGLWRDKHAVSPWRWKWQKQ